MPKTCETCRYYLADQMECCVTPPKFLDGRGGEDSVWGSPIVWCRRPACRHHEAKPIAPKPTPAQAAAMERIGLGEEDRIAEREAERDEAYSARDKALKQQGALARSNAGARREIDDLSLYADTLQSSNAAYRALFDGCWDGKGDVPEDWAPVVLRAEVGTSHVNGRLIVRLPWHTGGAWDVPPDLLRKAIVTPPEQEPTP